jgi:hypothetical protein
MKNSHTKEEIISVLEFVEEKISIYLKIVEDFSYDGMNWNLEKYEGQDVISITTYTYCCGDTDYKYYNVSFEKLLASTEEQVRIIEAERKAEIERKKQLEAERQVQRDLEKQQRDYEEYQRLKAKYEK